MAATSPNAAARDRSPAFYLTILIIGAILISFAPVLVKLLDNRMGAASIGLWRTLFGGIFLLVLCAVTGRSLVIDRRILPIAIFAGFLFCGDLYVWHRSIFLAGAGMATILANTQVFGTAILSTIVFKERLTFRFVIAALSAVGGVVLLVGVGSNFEFPESYLIGIAFGLATGLFYASYLVTLRVGGNRLQGTGTLALMGWVSLFSALFLVITGVIDGERLVPPNAKSWFVLALLGVIVHALAWWGISSALPKLPTSRVGLILLLQPVLATVWGWLLFDEILTVMQLVGASITLTAIYYGATSRRRRTKENGDTQSASPST